MIEQWVQEIEAAGRAALERVEHLPAVPPKLEAEIGYGQSWEEALEDVYWPSRAAPPPSSPSGRRRRPQAKPDVSTSR
jgi:hypothetical protein